MWTPQWKKIHCLGKTHTNTIVIIWRTAQLSLLLGYGKIILGEKQTSAIVRICGNPTWGEGGTFPHVNFGAAAIVRGKH